MAEQLFKVIGKSAVRNDGYAKVTGKAVYAADRQVKNSLFGVMVRLPVAHARINRIDYSPIEGHPGLIGICDFSDIPGDPYVGPIIKDHPVFAEEKVLSVTDAVAMIVGADVRLLRQLAQKIKIDYTALPVITEPWQALESGATVLHNNKPDNIIVHHELHKGNTRKAFDSCRHSIERTYTTPFIEHAYIETEAVTAELSPLGSVIEITGSIQNPYSTRKMVAEVLGFPLSRVRIRQTTLGGSFGGKDDVMGILSARAAIAALKTGKPVSIMLEREESIRESYKRHPYIIKYKAGFNDDGRILAMEADMIADGGAYASKSPFVTFRSFVQGTGPYEIENVDINVRAVYTNNIYTGSMRGFGAPQPIFAHESFMDEVALYLDKDPLNIRLINRLRTGSITATGQKLDNHEVTVGKILTTAAERTNFLELWRKNLAHAKPVEHSQGELRTGKFGNQTYVLPSEFFMDPDEVWRKGIGLAVSYRGCSLGAEGTDAAASYINIQADGSINLQCGLAENGQGLQMTQILIASEVLGVSPDTITYLDIDTGTVPDSGPTVASRGTLMGGEATKRAAVILRKRLEALIRQEWNLLEEAEILFANGMVSSPADLDMSINFTTLCRLAFSRGVSLFALGWYTGGMVSWDEETGVGDAYFTYSYSCNVAEVAVNRVTGQVIIERVTAVHDSGKIINLDMAKGQVCGGVVQGAGYGLWEELTGDDGKVRELNFDEYLIPTSVDVGEIVPIFIEGKDPHGPWGAKSLAESAIECTAPAISNAVGNALGERFYNLPLNLEEVLLKHKLRPAQKKRGSAQ